MYVGWYKGVVGYRQSINYKNRESYTYMYMYC